jgi:hypothetical protein
MGARTAMLEAPMEAKDLQIPVVLINDTAAWIMFRPRDVLAHDYSHN